VSREKRPWLNCKINTALRSHTSLPRNSWRSPDATRRDLSSATKTIGGSCVVIMRCLLQVVSSIAL